MGPKLCFAAAAILALPLTALADTTYNVDFSFANVSAVGTITGDGVTGSSFNILSYNLTLSNGVTTDTFDNTTGTLAYGGFPGVITTDDQGILFDFYGPDTFLVFQDTASGASLCFQNDVLCDANGNSVFIQTSSADAFAAGESLAGHQYIATVPSTPEPSSLVLLGTGLLGALGASRRRFLPKP